MSAIKHQFQVSNSYVLNKLRLLLFPWRHKPWSRKSIGGQAEGFLPPRDDINSPDLYIPSMAIVTYVLLSAVRLGLQGQFKPQLLGSTTSSAFVCICIEVMLVKLACYLLNIQGAASIVELAAYAGYKFVGIIVTMLAELVSSRSWIYWTVFLYVFFANGLFLVRLNLACASGAEYVFFQVRSLRYVVMPESAAGVPQTYTQAQRSRRVYFLFVVALCQLPMMLLLVYT